MKSLRDAHQAAGDARLAAGIADLARGELVDIHERYTCAVSDLAVPGVDTGPGAEAPAAGRRG